MIERPGCGRAISPLSNHVIAGVRTPAKHGVWVCLTEVSISPTSSAVKYGRSQDGSHPLHWLGLNRWLVSVWALCASVRGLCILQRPAFGTLKSAKKPCVWNFMLPVLFTHDPLQPSPHKKNRHTNPHLHNFSNFIICLMLLIMGHHHFGLHISISIPCLTRIYPLFARPPSLPAEAHCRPPEAPPRRGGGRRGGLLAWPFCEEDEDGRGLGR